MLLRRNTYRIGLVIVAILVASGAAYRVGWGHRSAAPEAPKQGPDTGGLAVAPERLNFGEVWETHAFRWSMPIRNDSDREITIETFVNSCGCTRVEPSRLVLPVGQTREVIVTIDHTLQKKNDDPPIRGFAVWLAPRVAVPGEKRSRQLAGWQLTGRVRSALKVTPTVIDLGRPSVRGDRMPDLQVRVKALTQLGAVYSYTGGVGFSSTVKPTVEPGEFNLVLRHDRGLPLGPIQFSVILVPCLPTGEELPEIKIPAFGEMRPDIQAMPEGGVAFGARPIGSVPEETVTLRSLTGRPFDVGSIKAEEESIQVDELPDPVAGTRSFRIREKITKARNQARIVTIKVQSNGEMTTVRVPVSYYGLTAK